MKKKAIILMTVTIFAKLVGFFREVFLAYYFGASCVTDAFLISLTIPGTLFAFVGAGLLTSYIPIYNEIMEEKDIDVGDRFTSNLVNVLLLFSVMLICFVGIFTRQIILIFASGFNKETLIMAIKFTRIGILSITFSTLIYIFSGYLQIKNKMIYVALSGIPASIFVLLSIIYGYFFGEIYLSIGSTLSILVQFLFLLPIIYSSGFKIKKVFTFKDYYLKKMLLLSVPVIVGVSVNQINVLVDKTIASRISIGGITSLMYANKINLFIQGIFVMPIATLLFIEISNLASKKNFKKLKVDLVKTVNVVGMLVIPMSIISIFFADEIVGILFGRGAFSEDARLMTSSALRYYSIGMIGFGLREIFSRVYYSIQDTKTPTFNAIIGMILNIILNIVLSKYLGIGGLALATSIAGIVTTMLLILNLKTKIGEYRGVYIIKVYLKIIFISIVMAIFSKLIFISLGVKWIILKLSVSIFSGGIIYILGIVLLKIEEASIIVEQLNFIKKRFTGGNNEG